jgi:hypothetical protein
MSQTAAWEKTLHSLYYDINQISALGSAYSLYKAAHAKLPDITLRFVKNWYDQQRAATLWRKAPKRFTKNPVVQTRPMWQVQSDLMDMGYFVRFNNGHRYVCVVIDVFTKKAFCRPLKKKSAQIVVPALQSILDPLTTVRIFQSDMGTEYFNATLKAYFRRRNIEVWLSEDRETKAQIAERFIQTLRSRIMRYMTAHDTKEWVSALPKLVSNYNNSHHRSIGMSPNSVNSDNIHQVRRTLYPPPPPPGPQIVSKAQKRRATSGHRPRRPPPRQRREDDVVVGDLVRISRIQERFEKLTFRWTDELFRVHQVIKRTPRRIYKLVDLTDEAITGSFYRENLLKVPKIIHQ